MLFILTIKNVINTIHNSNTYHNLYHNNGVKGHRTSNHVLDSEFEWPHWSLLAATEVNMQSVEWARCGIRSIVGIRHVVKVWCSLTFVCLIEPAASGGVQWTRDWICQEFVAILDSCCGLLTTF